jgi:hypothetical protein
MPKSLLAIGSIRRECLDHVVVVAEQHLRHILISYMEYYNAARTHLHKARMRRFEGSFSALAASKCGLSLGDCIINACGFDFR